MRERFDSDYIRAELEQIGGEVETPLQVFLIGGGAMAFRDLKDATKDIDLIVTGGDGLRQLQTGLQARGYEIVRQPGEEYDALGAQRIFENEDGCRIDLFNQQVIDKLVLSQGMRDRSEEFLSAGGLSVSLVSSEDIFLFKAVAGRTDDIEDMFVLYQTDLDFDVIETELQHQIELLGQELFVTYANEALVELEERYNITTPIDDTVAEITEHVYQEIEVLHTIEDTSSLTDLQENLDLTSEEIETVIQSLESKEVVTVDGDQVSKRSSIL